MQLLRIHPRFASSLLRLELQRQAGHRPCLQVVYMELPHAQPLEIAKRDVNYHHTLTDEWRSGLKPLNVVQPEGPSFQVCSLKHSTSAALHA